MVNTAPTTPAHPAASQNGMPTQRDNDIVDWRVSTAQLAYQDALAEMDARVAGVASGEAKEQVWLLEHPALYTAGTSAKPEHLLVPHRLPVFETGRGGEYTYHGPGQRVVYLMLDVHRRFNGDVRAFVDALEDWLIATLAQFDIEGLRGDGARGVWVIPPGSARQTPQKIASIGIRIRRGVSLHGLSINVAPDLDHFAGIIACGGAGEGQTSLAALGTNAVMEDVDQALKTTFRDTVLARGVG